MKRLAALLLASCGHAAPSPHPPPVSTDAGASIDADEAERTAAIEKAMNDLAPVAHTCWAAAAVDDFHLAGQLQLLVEVDEEGRAHASIQSDTTRDDVLTGCLIRVAEAYQWPPPMKGQATMLPFDFSAPDQQQVIDRRLVPDIDDGARVLLDARNSGDAAASIFELTVPAGTTASPTASARAEAWIYLDEPAATSVPKGKALEPVYLPPGTPRAPAAGATPLHVVIVSRPGGDEDASRRAHVLPASPADLRDKHAPKPSAKPGGGLTVTLTTLDHDGGAVAGKATRMLYVLDGDGTISIDGSTQPVNATSVVQIQAGASFTLSTHHLRYLDILIQN